MKFETITAVSLLALLMAQPVYANEGNASAIDNIKSGLSSADNGMRATADDIHGFLFDSEKDDKIASLFLRRDMTVNGLIGKAITNQNGKKVATLRDIVLSRRGKAILIVVSDDGVLGIGDKIAAFDFDKVAVVMPDGPTSMVLTQDMIDHAADFSYDRADWRTSKVIPKGSYSAKALLKSIVVDDHDKKVASINNIYFPNGKESQFILGFDKTFGMGGELAVADFSDLKMTGTQENPEFELTEEQSAELARLKEKAAR